MVNTAPIFYQFIQNKTINLLKLLNTINVQITVPGQQKIDENAYIVIVTLRHTQDHLAPAQALKSSAALVAELIQVRKQLRQRGRR
jgi:cellobiose-specific phosphotransferase system component IIA